MHKQEGTGPPVVTGLARGSRMMHVLYGHCVTLVCRMALEGSTVATPRVLARGSRGSHGPADPSPANVRASPRVHHSHGSMRPRSAPSRTSRKGPVPFRSAIARVLLSTPPGYGVLLSTPPGYRSITPKHSAGPVSRRAPSPRDRATTTTTVLSATGTEHCWTAHRREGALHPS